MKSWIPVSRVEGRASRQAHCDLPEGTYEREAGREGFFGPATQFHHRHPPTGWNRFDGPLRPRAFDLTRLEPAGPSPFAAPVILHNAHTQIRLWRTDGAMDHLVRNTDGDQVLFIHEGGGHLFCDYGHLAVREGDYVVLPRGTAWRVSWDGSAMVLLVEATNDAFGLPLKGPVGRQAIFDPAVLDVPAIDAAFLDQQDEAEWHTVVKRRNELTTLVHPFNPLDAVGWHGDLAPVRLNWRDIRPLMSHRYHVPPSAHTTWLADRVVICTFCPRPIESDPGALKLPYYHSNDDYDEVIFYHRGQFFSRDNIHPGMSTFHPAGFPHGPHPGAYQTAMRHARKETDEVAVMIDTRDVLEVGDLPAGVEWTGYADSWKTNTR
ncbi:homogentisate 1,2-dioxygenase [Roseospira visakhapatnamensis]|uniref:Homogentisate 1,2-dioxygenase n=1 Tax=Roseospira visakhapatnamensis TaxID=390880 RepID=A0A7W6RE95_9PROT|nr:homogentisate 1,2-dioxygenase [Roseospira visakhapatnamensis]MBB4266936.1 homogentisate 1,2-dioxygenase [Roseospira visakhapatnamensis]